MGILSSFLLLVLVDILFITLFVLAIIPLARYKQAAYAVLKRNFVGYFSNPTGYVFLGVFVLLTSFAAFWPHEFFAANLANLDQLSKWMPGIMLVFVPAISMGLWAEERRQGTDELLLTLPADDFDIVVGKYLSAASIFTASLLFSQITTFVVLSALALGEIDTGLFLSTYLGYWMIGLAMLALGMVASFLTSNLTISFILGAVFNVPLVFVSWADTIVTDSSAAAAVASWGHLAKFSGFSRGVISLAGVSYFAMIVIVGLYVSMVLIGRRHWLGGRDGQSMVGHYLARTVALIALTAAVSVIFSTRDYIRVDVTDSRVGTLSPGTRKILAELRNSPRPVQIEAFIGKDLPEQYLKVKNDLVSMLREFESLGAGKVVVRIHDNLETFSDTAANAERQYDIRPVRITLVSRETQRTEDILLAAAFTSGLQREVVPLFDLGLPVEYELIRSINTVAQEQRKKLGVLRTDAELMGGFDMQTFTQRPRQEIIGLLEHQYEVVEVDPNQAIEPDTYDVLLVAQPSSLTPPQLDNLIAAIERGQPTALFEDPFPVAMGTAPGTADPKQPRGGMMFRQPPEEKGDIRTLWKALGITMVGGESPTGMADPKLVWQDYNPYPRFRELAHVVDEWVFASPQAQGGDKAFAESEPMVSGLQELLFLFCGAVQSDGNTDLKFTELVRTGDRAGLISVREVRDNWLRDAQQLKRVQGRPTGKLYTLAARVQGAAKAVAAGPASPAKAGGHKGHSHGPGDTSHGTSADETGAGGSARNAATTATTAAEEGDEKAPPAPAPADDDDKAPPAPEPSGDRPAGGKKAPAPAPADDDDEAPPAPEASGDPPAGGKKAPAPAPAQNDAPAPKKKEIDVVYVTDIDLLHNEFVSLRARPPADIQFRFQNVSFVLNVIDALAGETRFLNIRKRETHYSTLQMIEFQADKARANYLAQIAEFQKEYEEAEKKANQARDEAIAEIQKQVRELESSGEVNTRRFQELSATFLMKQAVAKRQFETEVERLNRERSRQIEQIRRQMNLDILRIQNFYKACAVLLPPIFPILLAVVVFANRWLREREGVTASRMV